MERSFPQPSGEPVDLALRDDLTGAWNRRYLRRLLDEDWSALVAAQGTITLLVLDLDFFKEINDSHGHLAGDHVLQKAADQLRASFRAEDRLIRYGGDEFVVVLVEAPLEAAVQVAEGIRARIAATAVSVGSGVQAYVTVSIGVAAFDGHPDYQHLFNRADRAMAAAKGEGRDRVATDATGAPGAAAL